MDERFEGLTLESFSIPASSVSLAKGAKGHEEDWVVEGLASTASEDQQGEVVLVKGLDLTYLDQGKGTFNWNHFGDKDPSSVIGLICENRRTELGELFVKGKLLKGLPKAQAAYTLMKALDQEGESRRMGMSIEGKVLHRHNKVIYKAWVKAVALTMDPVNPDTYVRFAKSFAGAEYVPESGESESWIRTFDPSILERALSIASSSSGSSNGGSILSPEHVEGDLKNLEWAANRLKTKREKMSKGLTFDEAVRHVQSMSPTIDREIAESIVQFAFTRQEPK